MVWVELGVPYRADPRAWTVFGADRAHTCRVPGASEFKLLPTPAKTSEPSGASFVSYGDQMLLTGSNVWRFDVVNPGNERLVLTTDIVHPNGVVHRFAKHVRGARQRVAVQFEASEPGAYGVGWKLIDADRRTVLSSSTASFSFEGLESDLAYLDGVLLKQTLDAAEAWKQTNPTAAGHVRDELRTLRGTLATLNEAEDADRARSVPALRKSAGRLRSLAVAGKALAPTGSFFAWEANPWAYFDALDSLPAPENRTEGLSTALCVGEYESLAVNLTNVSERTLEVRVLPGNLVGEKTYPARDHLEFRRAVAVSSIRRERVADALPGLDQGRLVTLPSLESQQLWITVNAVGMEPGDYISELRLKSVEPDPTEVAIPIEVKVWELALPRPRPLRFCLWSYDSGPLGVKHEYALKDLVDHGVTVFFGSAPSATCDAEGNLVGEMDFTKHDESVRLLSPHGIMLFVSPQGSLRGQPFLSEPWRKAFVSYLRVWVSHMNELGMDYDRYALYPYDEPSTPYAQTTVNLVEVAKLVREADPNILIYTDPTSGTTMETVRMFTGLIDIWCPSAELLERLGDELVPEAKRVGKEVWFYDASGRSRTLSCLGLYRWRFWYAWNLGFTGAGWWTYATHSEDLWDGPNPTGDYFATAYDGEGVVSSRRWEVAREGVEDYEILYLLRDAIQRARERGVPASVVREAETLLEELPHRVEAALHETGRRLPLTPDSVPVYEQATDIIQDARKQIVEMCLRLSRQESL